MLQCDRSGQHFQLHCTSARYTGKAPGELLNFISCLISLESSLPQLPMAAQVRKRAPAFSIQETLDLIAMWGEEPVQAELFAKIAQRMGEKGYTRDARQCRVKIKALMQAYQKTRMANSRSGAEPQTCRFYEQLHAIIGRDSISFPIFVMDTSGPHVDCSYIVDEEDIVDEKDMEEEENAQQSSGGSILPENQDLFLTLEPIPSQDPLVRDCDGGEGTSAATWSLVGASSTPAQRLSQIRRRKKRTREDMFCDLMHSSEADRAQPCQLTRSESRGGLHGQRA